MPIYEYACNGCGHDFEAIVGVRTPNPSCPECQGETDKKISLSAFHLKGGGWYSDAYSGQDNKKPGDSKSSSSSDSKTSTPSSDDSSSPSKSSKESKSSKPSKDSKSSSSSSGSSSSSSSTSSSD